MSNKKNDTLLKRVLRRLNAALFDPASFELDPGDPYNEDIGIIIEENHEASSQKSVEAFKKYFNEVEQKQRQSLANERVNIARKLKEIKGEITPEKTKKKAAPVKESKKSFVKEEMERRKAKQQEAKKDEGSERGM